MLRGDETSPCANKRSCCWRWWSCSFFRKWTRQTRRPLFPWGSSGSMLTHRSTSWCSANSFEACCPRIRNLWSTISPTSHSCSLPAPEILTMLRNAWEQRKLIFNYKIKKKKKYGSLIIINIFSLHRAKPLIETSCNFIAVTQYNIRRVYSS